MSYLPRFSRSSSDLIGAFKAELARAGAVTGLADSVSALWPRFAACYQGLARLPRKARRALQRRWRRSLAGIALLYALGHVPAALAAQIDVGVGGCTLVNAITAANTDQQTNGCLPGSGTDTIILPAGSTQTLTSGPYSSGGPTGLPVITSAIVIDGNGSTIARDPAASEFRILGVGTPGNLTLQETTITGGRINSISVGSYNGGGIQNLGALTLTNSTVSGNSADSGGGVHNSGTLSLTNSTVSGNFAGADGGGVYNSDSLTLTNSTVSGNSANEDGGGVYHSGSATVNNSTISGNSANDAGAGIFNYRGTLTLTSSTISGNSAGNDGGGVYNFGTLTLTNSTVSGNSVSSRGPEVYNQTFEFIAAIITNAFNLFGHDGIAGVAGFTPARPTSCRPFL